MEKQTVAVAEKKMEDSPNPHQKLTQQSSKGGFRTLPFILANESFEKVASFGLIPNMIFYLMNGYHIESANASSLLSAWSATSNAMAIVGAHLSDSYLGRFWVIVLGSFSSLLGTTILWLTAMIPQLKPSPCTKFSHHCPSASQAQLIVLLSSFGLISIGAGCVRPCSMAFGADQLDKKDNNPSSQRLVQSFFNWYYVSSCLSTVVAFTIIVYIQEHLGWELGFGVPALLMLVSTLLFLAGSNLYMQVKPENSLLTGFIQVIVASFRKRSLDPSCNNEEYYQGQDSMFITPTNNLRFLNKACIIENPEEELNPDGIVLNPWRLCSIDQVESLKALLRVIPIWSTCIIINLNHNSLSALQIKIMDRHITPNFEIPVGSFTFFTIITLTIWLVFYDRAVLPILIKFTGNPRGLGPKVRIGIGLVLSAVAMATSAVVESIRRKTAIEQGLVDKPETVMDMSAMWLLPFFCLFGLAEAFTSVGQIEFYYSQLPKSMGSIAMAMYTLGMAVGNLLGSLLVKIVDGVTKRDGEDGWLSSNLNKGHLDYYYILLTLIYSVNFGYFLVCCWTYGPPNDGTKMLTDKRRARKDETLREPLIV